MLLCAYAVWLSDNCVIGFMRVVLLLYVAIMYKVVHKGKVLMWVCWQGDLFIYIIIYVTFLHAGRRW